MLLARYELLKAISYVSKLIKIAGYVIYHFFFFFDWFNNVHAIFHALSFFSLTQSSVSIFHDNQRNLHMWLWLWTRWSFSDMNLLMNVTRVREITKLQATVKAIGEKIRFDVSVYACAYVCVCVKKKMCVFLYTHFFFAFRYSNN